MSETTLAVPTLSERTSEKAPISKAPVSFEEILKGISNERTKDILKLRFQEGLSLEEIGKKYGLSRERIRQIISREVKSNLMPLKKALEHYIRDSRLIDLRKTPWYGTPDEKAAKNFAIYVFKLTPFRVEYILVRRRELLEIEKMFEELENDLMSYVPLGKLRKLIVSKGFRQDEVDIVVELLGAIVEDGKVLAYRNITVQQNVLAVLNGLKRPVHVRELEMLLEPYFKATGKKFSTVRGLLNPRFHGTKRRLPLILFDRGTYVSEKVFLEEVRKKTGEDPIEFLEFFTKQVADVVMSRGIEGWMDVLFLQDLLRVELTGKSREFVETLTPYLLKDILVLYGPFVRGRKFEIRLKTEKEVPRMKYADLIYEFISNDPKGYMNINEILNAFVRIGKKPRWYVIIMAIQNDPRFIKVGYSTYAVKDKFAPDADKIVELVVSLLEKRAKPTFYGVVLRHVSERFPYVAGWSHHPIYWILRKNENVVLLNEKVYAHSNKFEKKSFNEWIDEKLDEYNSPLCPTEVKRFLKELEEELGGLDEGIKHQLLYTGPVCVYFAGWLIQAKLLKQPEKLEGLFEKETSTFLDYISRISENERGVSEKKFELFRLFLEWYAEKRDKKMARELMRKLKKVMKSRK